MLNCNFCKNGPDCKVQDQNKEVYRWLRVAMVRVNGKGGHGESQRKWLEKNEDADCPAFEDK